MEVGDHCVMSKHPKGLVHKLGASFLKALSDRPSWFGRVAGDDPSPEFGRIVRSDARSASLDFGSSKSEKFSSEARKNTPVRKLLGDDICMARHSWHPKIKPAPIRKWVGENSGMTEDQDLPVILGAASRSALIKGAGEALCQALVASRDRVFKISKNAFRCPSKKFMPPFAFASWSVRA
jgi:hypothetical protein